LRCFAKVPDGIKEAAYKSSILIHPKDLEWLSLHHSRCEQHEPPNCEGAFVNLKRFEANGKAEQDLDESHMSSLHKVRKPSTGFPHMQKHNTQVQHTIYRIRLGLIT